MNRKLFDKIFEIGIYVFLFFTLIYIFFSDNKQFQDESFFYYIRVFAPMIGAIIGGIVTYKVAMLSFEKNKFKEEEKEQQRLLETRELVLTSLIQTYLKIDEAISKVVPIIQSYGNKVGHQEFLLEFKHSINYLPSESLSHISKQDFHKILIVNQINEIENIYTYYDYFIQSLIELNRIQNMIDILFFDIRSFLVRFEVDLNNFYDELLKQFDWDSDLTNFIDDNRNKMTIHNDWKVFLANEKFIDKHREILIKNKAIMLKQTNYMTIKLEELGRIQKELIKIAFLFSFIINAFFSDEEVEKYESDIKLLNNLIKENYKEFYDIIYKESEEILANENINEQNINEEIKKS